MKVDIRRRRVTPQAAGAVGINGRVLGDVADQAELARLGRVSRARVTQVLNLLNLAPDIQEEILHLPLVTDGRDPVTERDLRPITAEVDCRWCIRCIFAATDCGDCNSRSALDYRHSSAAFDAMCGPGRSAPVLPAVLASCVHVSESKTLAETLNLPGAIVRVSPSWHPYGELQRFTGKDP